MEQNYVACHIGSSQLICSAIQLTGFCLMTTLAFNELRIQFELSFGKWLLMHPGYY